MEENDNTQASKTVMNGSLSQSKPDSAKGAKKEKGSYGGGPPPSKVRYLSSHNNLHDASTAAGKSKSLPKVAEKKFPGVQKLQSSKR